jgi:hypothetical protein
MRALAALLALALLPTALAASSGLPLPPGVPDPFFPPPLVPAAGAADSCVVVLTGSCTFACDTDQPFVASGSGIDGMITITCDGTTLYHDFALIMVDPFNPVVIHFNVPHVRGVGTCSAAYFAWVVCANPHVP